jgi:hypothetical protein
VLLAGLLWKKTTVSQSWIAEYLGMKNASNIGMAIHLIALSLIKKKVSSKLARFVSEKVKENKPCPQFPARIVHFFIAFLVKLEFCVSKQRSEKARRKSGRSR